MNTSNYIDINHSFSEAKEIECMIASAIKEKERIFKELDKAYNAKRSDRREWKIRHEALQELIRGLEKLKIQVLVTSGRTPLI